MVKERAIGRFDWNGSDIFGLNVRCCDVRGFLVWVGGILLDLRTAQEKIQILGRQWRVVRIVMNGIVGERHS